MQNYGIVVASLRSALIIFRKNIEMKMLKRIFLALLVGVFLFSLSCISDPKSPIEKKVEKKKESEKKKALAPLKSPGTHKEKVLFYLSDKAVTEGEYKEYLYQFLGKRYLEDFITQRLVEARAQDLAILVSKEEILNWVEKKMGALMAEARGQENLEEQLKKRGLFLRDLVENIRKNAPLMLRLEKIIKHDRLQEGALKRAYEEKFGPKVTLEGILFSFEKAYEKEAEELARERALEVSQKIKSKKLTFGEAVKFYSEAAKSSRNNGSLGWVLTDKLDPDIKKAVLSMSVGDISDPIKTRYGYHILYYKDQKAAYVNLYQIFFSQNYKKRLTEERQKELQKEVAKEAQKFYQQLKEKQLPFEEVLSQKEKNYRPQKLSFRPHACPYGKKMEEVAFSLKAGEIGAPFPSKEGYHIFRISEAQPPLRSYDEKCKEDLKKILLEEEVSEQEILQLEKKLRQEGKIRRISKD